MSRGSLAGLRILLTRPEGDGAEEWATAFKRAGALPIAYPTVSIVPPESWLEVDKAVANLDAYGWLIFTSRTAARFFASRLPNGLFASALRAEIAAVGQRTANSIERLGGKVALVPTDSRQEGLVKAMRFLPAGTRVLMPLASGARPLLAQSLQASGCHVDVVTVYRTQLKEDLATPPEFDAAVFASPSALRAFADRFGASALAEKTIAVIGPTTAKEAESRGLRVVVADSPGVDALARALSKTRLNPGGT